MHHTGPSLQGAGTRQRRGRIVDAVYNYTLNKFIKVNFKGLPFFVSCGYKIYFLPITAKLASLKLPRENKQEKKFINNALSLMCL